MNATESIEIKWDDKTDSSNPGWVVKTETAGWQPLGGKYDKSRPPIRGLAQHDDMAEQAKAVVSYHDAGGSNPY